MANTATMAIATNIFTSPGEAFAAIKERPSPWVPLLVVVVCYAAVSVLYLNGVDLPWLFDQQMRAAGQMTDEQRAQTVDAMLSIPKGVYLAFGILSALITFPLVYAIGALYYTGVSFFTNTGVKFKQWFALSAWVSLPIVLGLLATIVNLLANDVRFVAQESLNPLSFGNLLSIDPTGTPTLQRVLLSLDPTTIWSVVLSVFGYQALSQRSTVHATLVVLGPWVVIVLIAVALTL
jgi:hypothetical protein